MPDLSRDEVRRLLQHIEENRAARMTFIRQIDQPSLADRDFAMWKNPQSGELRLLVQYEGVTHSFLVGSGPGSSLTDADTLDGFHASAFAGSGHLHDAEYISVLLSGTGNLAEITAGGELTDSGFAAADFALSGHDHDTAYISVLGSGTGNLPQITAGGELEDSGFAATDFALASHTHPGGGHTHDIDDEITGLDHIDTELGLYNHLNLYEDDSIFLHSDWTIFHPTPPGPENFNHYTRIYSSGGITHVEMSNPNTHITDYQFIFDGSFGVLISGLLSVLSQITISPPAPLTAPFAIGTNAQDVRVPYLNADKIDGLDEGDLCTTRNADTRTVKSDLTFQRRDGAPIDSGGGPKFTPVPVADLPPDWPTPSWGGDYNRLMIVADGPGGAERLVCILKNSSGDYEVCDSATPS
jgi:hypothetical protein